MDKYYHPNDSLIAEYAKGTISPGLGLLVSAHIKQCEECFFKIENLSAREAQSLKEAQGESPINLDEAFDALMGEIDEIVEPALQEEESPAQTLHVKGQEFTLPLGLTFALEKPVNWKEFGKKSCIAPVMETERGNLYFIYLGPGEEIPNHDHEAVEYSYVVQGCYESQGHFLSTGTFSQFNNGEQHSPRAVSDDGCLVVSWVEKRLNFFTGVFYPLNKLLWWYLHKA